MIEIYTDGSFRKSQNQGGYGIVIFKDNTLIYVYQEQQMNTTNNEMELMAIAKACQIADHFFPLEDVRIYSDSQYCVNSINNWMYSWADNNWRNSKKEEVKNIKLMKLLYSYFTIDFYHCQVIWNKGHDGIMGNELADALASHNRQKFIKILSENKIALRLIDLELDNI